MSANILDDAIDLRESALRLLAQRDYSQTELQKKLKSKGFDLDKIETMMTELAQMHLLNDQRFTENYIHRRRNKGYGPQRIRMELQSLGIQQELIAECLNHNDEHWLQEAYKVWHKQFKGQKAADFKNRAKQTRFLAYRGFTQEQIKRLLKGYDDFTNDD